MLDRRISLEMPTDNGILSFLRVHAQVWDAKASQTRREVKKVFWEAEVELKSLVENACTHDANFSYVARGQVMC